jgi:hypothetical protein
MFFDNMGCSETQNEANPWARIDFGREVPLAVVRMFTRSDTQNLALGPIELYIGNNPLTWGENFYCARHIYLTRNGPTEADCLMAGRYLWIVLRREGSRSSPLSLCEVEVVPKGPDGTKHILQTTGEMFSLTLEGTALSKNDRVRIVPYTTWCGKWYASAMDIAVLPRTAPFGAPEEVTSTIETWPYVLIQKAGTYKVCWCGIPPTAGKPDPCTDDEHFGFHVATIIVNGVIMTLAGNGVVPNPALGVQPNPSQGIDALSNMLQKPYGIAATANILFVSERDAYRIRYIDISTGSMSTLCGLGYPDFHGDGGPAKLSGLVLPLGLGLSVDETILYVADSMAHKIRQIDLTQKPLESGHITTVAGNGFSGNEGDGLPATQAQLNAPTCAHEDSNRMLYICDTGNFKIRVVSLDIPVLIPGTADFAAGIILTAAGNGLNGMTGERGDGRLSTLSQVG